ncbi:hypothetical protein HPB51_022386 [Rhipicephalus microplus]|uniref:Uncharacterized protein n=1 Tax=Rhipicephalus microplus TaxID=6941 RepID=A0A9J6DQB5_RHIMP|nr:hypothetical protein HPB51_022386 [Rhipicephalus microplus]
MGSLPTSEGKGNTVRVGCGEVRCWCGEATAVCNEVRCDVCGAGVTKFFGQQKLEKMEAIMSGMSSEEEKEARSVRGEFHIERARAVEDVAGQDDGEDG